MGAGRSRKFYDLLGYILGKTNYQLALIKLVDPCTRRRIPMEDSDFLGVRCGVDAEAASSLIPVDRRLEQDGLVDHLHNTAPRQHKFHLIFRNRLPVLRELNHAPIAIEQLQFVVDRILLGFSSQGERCQNAAYDEMRQVFTGCERHLETPFYGSLRGFYDFQKVGSLPDSLRIWRFQNRRNMFPDGVFRLAEMTFGASFYGDFPACCPLLFVLYSGAAIRSQIHLFPGRPATDYRVRRMTIDKSLKIKAGSTKSRNVLTRPERLEKLIETDRWQEGDAIYGLPKVRVQKISLKKKKKVKKEDEEES